jgi:hypothetical protein
MIYSWQSPEEVPMIRVRYKGGGRGGEREPRWKLYST